MSKLTQSNLGCAFAVAAFVGVTYDWGEHDNIKGPLIFYKYFLALTFGQEVCQFYDWSSHFAKNGFIGRIGLGESSLMSMEHT